MTRRDCGFGNKLMKRSALYYAHRHSGATFGEYSGWELPSFFARQECELAQIPEAAGITDTSHYCKVDLRSDAGPNSWHLGAGHYLSVSESSKVLAGGINVTSVYTSLRLAGPRATAVLGKLTPLNIGGSALPNMSCAQATLAHVPTIFLREDIGSLLAFHLLITREYAESIWQEILHAGHEFHICPFGLEALRLLRG